MNRPAASGFAALLALILGCSLPRPRPAEYDYFVLTPLAGAPAREGASAPEGAPAAGREGTPAAHVPILVVGSVAVPDYLDRDGMATRVAEQQLTYSTRERWAEPLDEGLARTLRQNLAVLLGPRVSVQPLSVATPPDYSVRVDVLRFERLGTDRVELWARFTVHSAGELAQSGETHIVEPASGKDASAATDALSRALAHMSRDIAAAVLGVVSKPANPGAAPGG